MGGVVQKGVKPVSCFLLPVILQSALLVASPLGRLSTASNTQHSRSIPAILSRENTSCGSSFWRRVQMSLSSLYANGHWDCPGRTTLCVMSQ
ncbi:hypothetical protein F5Y16DRAFT_375994 [Xylariaceae sp. FL0255]|nr:hypothetical protein F5Y16DRAFT_375994 [Xylariaceae sp. FL0255]